ncbi:hypothetical protein Hanom_Chr14g01310691 [Helianthus anomalus]
MAELNNSNEEPQVLPPKRKQTLDEDESTKKLRPDTEPPAAVEHKPNSENDNKSEEEEEEEDYEAEDELDSDDEDEDEDEHSEIDRKGKGIMKDDKGKGKMIEESEEEDDDDSDDEDGGGASESDGDDDFSDDPLAEVDLDNILPSRTRRRTASRGVQISGEEVGNDKGKDA